MTTMYGTANTALIFQCGCTWPWAGGSSNCNIHNPMAHTVRGVSRRRLTQFLVDDRVMVMLMVLSYVSEVPCSATKACKNTRH